MTSGSSTYIAFVRGLNAAADHAIVENVRDTSALFVPGQTPGLNEIIAAKATRYGKGGASAYSKMKSEWTGLIKLLARSKKIPAVESAYFTYLFHEKDKRRDPSNFVAGGVKMIEDGLKTAGVLKNDGWGQVLGYVPYWFVDAKRPGVTVFLHPTRVLTAYEAMNLVEKS